MAATPQRLRPRGLSTNHSDMAAEARRHTDVRRSARLLAAAALAGVVATQPALGRAGATLPACTDPGVHIALRLDDGLEPSFATALVVELSSELAHRGDRLCLGPSDVVPTALDVSARGPGAVVLRATTPLATKERIVELTNLPPDGRVLAVALAADELLSAAATPHAPLPAASPHPESVPPRQNAPATPDTQARVGLAAMATLYSTGTLFAGPELVGSTYLGHDWGVEMALGGRLGRVQESDNGSVDSAAAAFRVALLHRTYRATWGELQPQLGLFFGWYGFEGKAEPGAQGRTFSGAVVAGQATLNALVPLDTWGALKLGAGATLPFGDLLVEDNGKLVGGVGGVGATVLFGLGVNL